MKLAFKRSRDDYGLHSLLRRAAFLLLCFWFLLAGDIAHADTTPALFSSFAGTINFVGTSQSLRTSDASTCAVNTATTTATLSGIPSGATIKAAYLYWAGSSTNTTTAPDYTVTFEGGSVSAATARRYTATYNNDGTNLFFFSGVADVTTTVSAKGNGSYSFSGLTVNTGSPHCDVSAVLAGWSLAVVYSHSSEDFRVINVFEGFQTYRGSSITQTPGNFKIPTSSINGKHAYITWEGDIGNSDTLNGFSEGAKFNGNTLSDTNNPVSNQFNSSSNITGAATTTYGVDFDVFNVGPYLAAGQTSATTVYSSGGDLVLLSAEIISVTNTAVADLGISMVRDTSLVPGQTVTYTLTVTNNGPSSEPGSITVTDILPSGLTYSSFSGAEWSCGASGQTVTCTRSGSLDSGSSSSVALTVSIASDASGAKTNSATVAGVAFDNVSGNNTATDSYTISADLAISMTREDTMTLGQNNSYAIVITNNGPNAEPGPITVTDTLPSVLTFVSGGGTNWSCSAVGQAVTCTYSGGSTASGASVPTLTLIVGVTSASSSTITNSATVVGTMPDSVSSNNTASNSTTINVPRYVFTDSVCSHNNSFGAGQTCKLLTWSALAAGQIRSGIYITVLNSGGTPTRLHASQSRTVSLQFALSCHNPTTNAGVKATFSAAAAALPLCVANGATPTAVTDWSAAVNLTFPGNTPSVGPYSFSYADVGKVELFLRESTTTSNGGSSGAFVVKPASFGLTAIQQTASPNLANPVAADAAGAAFVKAGESFSVKVTAQNSSGAATPNYGKETSPETVKLTPALVTGLGLTNNPAIGGGFGSFSGGSAEGTAFTWNEVGIITLTPSVGDGDYLGAGDVAGTTTGNVGRFSAGQFLLSGTGLTNRTDLCTTGAETACSSGFTYMGEQMKARFTLTAAAVGGTTALTNYTATSDAATSFAKLNPATTVTTGASGPFVIAAVNNAGTTRTVFPACTASPAHSCITPATATGTFTSGVAAVTLPLTVFRGTTPGDRYANLQIGIAPVDGDNAAMSSFDLDTNSPASTNNKATVASADVRYGRLRLSNAHGSELLPLPIVTTLQYWNGTAYVTNTDDSATTFSTASLVFDDYKTPLAVVNVITPPTTVVFAGGIGKFRLAAPGAGKSGSVRLNVNINAYLPSSPGDGARATFGVYGGNSRFIYFREVY